MFRGEDEFDNAHAHIRQAQQHALNDKYCLGRAVETLASIWYKQGRLEDTAFEALRAIEIYETLGASEDLGNFLHNIEQATKVPPNSCEPDSNGELLEMKNALLSFVNFSFNNGWDATQRLSNKYSSRHQPRIGMNTPSCPLFLVFLFFERILLLLRNHTPNDVCRSSISR